MDYTREREKKIKTMHPELVIKVIMPERNGEGRMIGQPIMITHIYFDNERFHIRNKRRPVMCKSFYSLDI